MNKRTLLPHIILLGTTLIAGINYSIAKVLMPDFISPSAIILTRSISSVFFFGILWFISPKEKIEKRDLKQIILASFLGIASNQLLFMEGLNKSTPINAALMMTSSPVIVFLVSALIYKERITLVKILGIVLAASGAISLLLHSFSIAAHTILLGDIYIIMNASCWALFLVIIKPLVTKYRTTTIIPVLFLFGFMMVLPFGAHDFVHTQFAAFTTVAWLALAFVIVFSTWVAYYLNIHVMKFVNPSIAGIYIYLQPVLATIFSLMLGKDELSVEKIFFSLLIFSGVYLVSKRPAKITTTSDL